MTLTAYDKLLLLAQAYVLQSQHELKLCSFKLTGNVKVMAVEYAASNDERGNRKLHSCTAERLVEIFPLRCIFGAMRDALIPVEVELNAVGWPRRIPFETFERDDTPQMMAVRHGIGASSLIEEIRQEQNLLRSVVDAVVRGQRRSNGKSRHNLTGAAKSMADFIDKNPGSIGRQIAKAIATSEGYVRQVFKNKLRALGYRNERDSEGYFPPM